MSKHDEFTLSSKQDPKGVLDALDALKQDLVAKEWWVKSHKETSLAECREFAKKNNVSVDGNKRHVISYLKAFVVSGYVPWNKKVCVLGEVATAVESPIKKQKKNALPRQESGSSSLQKKSVSVPKVIVVEEGKNLSEDDANIQSKKALAAQEFSQALNPQVPTDDEVIQMILKVHPNFQEPLSLTVVSNGTDPKEDVLQPKTKQLSLDINIDKSVSAFECCFTENNFTLPEREGRNERDWKALLWNILAIGGFIFGVKALKGTTLLPEFCNLTGQTFEECGKSKLQTTSPVGISSSRKLALMRIVGKGLEKTKQEMSEENL